MLMELRPPTHLYDFLDKNHFGLAASRAYDDNPRRKLFGLEKGGWGFHDTPIDYIPTKQTPNGIEKGQFFQDLLEKAKTGKINVLDVGGDIRPWKVFFSQHRELIDNVTIYVTKLRKLNTQEQRDAKSFNCVFVASRAGNLWKKAALKDVRFHLAVASNSMYGEVHMGIENIFHLLHRNGRLYFNISSDHDYLNFSSMPMDFDPKKPKICSYQKIPRNHSGDYLQAGTLSWIDDLHIIEKLIN